MKEILDFSLLSKILERKDYVGNFIHFYVSCTFCAFARVEIFHKCLKIHDLVIYKE